MEKYDPAENRWTQLQEMPEIEIHGWDSLRHAAVTYNGQIYVFSASYESTGELAVHCYLPSEDRWVQCGPAPEAPRGFAGAAKCDGMVLVFSRSGHVYAYEPETDSWRSLSAAPPGFFCHEIVVA